MNDTPARADAYEPVRSDGGRRKADGTTTAHVHEETFDATADDLFNLLVKPSAIRVWWGASRAIIAPHAGGLWAAAWGDDEDEPEYVTSATITAYDPPHRLTLGDYAYLARSGPLPFEADFTTTFSVQPVDGGTILRVVQDGFPAGPDGVEFLAACEKGWRDTFAGIRRFLRSNDA